MKGQIRKRGDSYSVIVPLLGLRFTRKVGKCQEIPNLVILLGLIL